MDNVFLLGLLMSSGLFLGWSLGANDARNIFGSAVGSRMVSFRTAATVSSIFIILGAVIQGAGASHTLGDLGKVSAIGGAFVVALSAAITVAYMTKLKLPVSTTQAIVGAILGWNLFSGNPTNSVSFGKVVSTWLFSPILAAIFSIILYLIHKKIVSKTKIHLITLDHVLRISLIVIGAFGAYSLGANNISNVMGVFINSIHFEPFDFGLFSLSSIQQLFLIGAIAISIGVFTYSKKMMMAVGGELVKMTTEASLIVVLAHSLVLFIFSSATLSDFVFSFTNFRIPLVPVSSSQAIVGAILGIGLLKGGREIKYKQLGEIVLGWIFTPISSLLISLILLYFFKNVFQLPVV